MLHKLSPLTCLLMTLISLAACDKGETTEPTSTPPTQADDAPKTDQEAPADATKKPDPKQKVKEEKAPADTKLADTKPTDTKPAGGKLTKADIEEQRAYEASLGKVKYDPKLHGGEGIEGYENKFEWDPTMTRTIERVDTTGKLWLGELDRLSENNLQPDTITLKHMTWTDRTGTNLLKFSKKDLKGGGIQLFIEIAYYEGSAWIVHRTFKEMVATCDFDLVMDTYMDESWTLTDVDKDGHAEVTVAYTSGCTSDVSPNTHKVLSLHKKDKYALRGNSKIDAGGGVTEGGDYKVDPAFKKAPKGLLEHAKKVWDTTSKASKIH